MSDRQSKHQQHPKQQQPKRGKRKGRKWEEPFRKRGRFYYFDACVNGKRIRESLKTTNRDVARRLAFARLRKLQSDGALAPERADRRLPIADLVERWLHAKRDLAPSTLHRYRAGLEIFQREIPVTVIGRLRPEHLNVWRESLRDKIVAGDLCSKSADDRRKVAQQFLRFCHEQGFLGFLCDMKSVRQRGYKVRRDVVRDEEFDDLLSVLAGTRWEPFVLFAFYAGLRSTEVLRLDWSQVDLERRTIYLEHTKGNKPRVARIRRAGIERLRRLRRPAGRVTPELRTYPERSDWSSTRDFERAVAVFSSRTAKGFTRAVESRTDTDSPLRRIRPHLLRHSFITICLEAGVPIAKVAASAGHSTTWVTEVYAHVDPTQGEFAA